MKRIIIVIPTLSGGGAEKVMLTYAEHLAIKGHRVKVIIINGVGEYTMQDDVKFDFEFLNKRSVKSSIFKLKQSIEQFEADVVFSSLAYLNFIILLLRPLIDRKIIYIVREGNSPSMTYQNRSYSKNILYKFLYRKLYDKADYVISQCDEMREELLEIYKLKGNNIRTIYNPLDLKKIQSQYEEFNPYINSTYINIVAAGRLTKQKGFDILLRSIYILKKEYKNIKLHILGVGPEKHELLKLTSKLNLDDNIEFHGFQKNPYPYFKFSDLFVLSSRYEGFPNVLLEALACNCKVVATECKTGTKEIIENNKYGILAEPENFDDLANSISKALKTENKNSNRAQDYSVENAINHLESLFG